MPRLVPSRNFEIVYLAAGRRCRACFELASRGLALQVTLHPASSPTHWRAARQRAGLKWSFTAIGGRSVTTSSGESTAPWPVANRVVAEERLASRGRGAARFIRTTRSVQEPSGGRSIARGTTPPKLPRRGHRGFTAPNGTRRRRPDCLHPGGLSRWLTSRPNPKLKPTPYLRRVPGQARLLLWERSKALRAGESRPSDSLLPTSERVEDGRSPADSFKARERSRPCSPCRSRRQ